ncbi:MAG TPA: class I SAM-dependent methyltransferase, partial [Roseomonas sp.]
MKTAEIPLDDVDLVRRAKVNEVWSADSVRDAQELGQYWLAHPMVRDRVNRLASGRADQDAYGHLADLLAARGWRLPIGHALSLGCGFGGLERDLVGRGLVTRMDALDLAEGAITEARRLAEEAGLGGRIHYQVADLEAADFAPGSADVVFAHSSVHHVERLEELFAAVKRALRPGGVLHLYEFVGPTRFQWTDAQLELGNALLDSLPERLRRLPNGEPKGRLTRPTIEQMLAVDPTEAIRSEDILPLVREHFTVIEERRLGGALLHHVLGDIAQNFHPDSPEDRAVLERFFAAEDAAMADRRIGSDFVTVTAVLPQGAPEAPRPRALLTSLSLLFPPVRRLHAALIETQAQVARLTTEQTRLSSELSRLS